MSDVLNDVRSVLRTTPGRWEVLVRSLPTKLLERQPAKGEWSAVDCLRHLVDAERCAFTARTRDFLTGAEVLATFDPNAQASSIGARATDLAVEFARLRASTLTLLESVTVEDLGRKSRHTELGPVTLGQMLNEWAAHDLMHTVQAEHALMQSFLPDTGPWRDSFKDHDVDAKGRVRRSRRGS
jgi:DinB superfamily